MSANVESIYRLTPAQEGMLFHVVEAPHSGVYHQQIACSLSGRVDAAALQEAWTWVIGRHAALRTLFTWERRVHPLQIVRQAVTTPWQELDWRPEAADASLAAWLAEDRRQGFELSRAPLMRLALARVGDDAAWMVWSFQHLVLDGWSAALVLREVFDRYAARQRGVDVAPPIGPSFQDHVRWLQQQADTETQERFWRSRLAGFTSPTSVSASLALLPDTAASGVSHHTIRLSAEQTAEVLAFAQRVRVTVNTIVQGAWALLLARYTGREDVLFGITVSGRPATLDGVDRMVGMFINTLPLRVTVTGDVAVERWLQELQAQNVELREYEHSSLARVQALSDVARGVALFDSILAFENYPSAGSLGSDMPQLRVERLEHHDQSNYPLAVLVVPEARMRIIVVTDPARYPADVAQRIGDHVATLISELASSASRPVSAVPMVVGAERQQLVVDWNRARVEPPSGRTIVDFIDDQIATRPDAIALTCGVSSVTYRELDRRANAVAQRLSSLGVGRGHVVGIYARRTLEFPIGIVGVLKAGAAYLPLDASYPEARLSSFLDTAEVSAVLVGPGLRVPSTTRPAPVVHLDATHGVELDDSAMSGSSVALGSELRARPSDPAYVIFTSGSTGAPKGVPVSHEQLVHSTLARSHVYDRQVGAFLLLSSFSFDSSVAGVFWTLSQGGALCLAQDDEIQDVLELAECIRHRRVTHTLCLPSLYRVLLDHAPEGALDSLEVVVVAGEPCPPSLPARHRACLPGAALFNEYGPTEGTVWSTVMRIDQWRGAGTVPIGRPIPNTQAYILDGHRQPVPVGAVGELFIGGAGVVEGYWRRPDLSAERFLDNPFAPGRLYRTGDRARWRDGGTIEFLGRTDQQVKIRGFRVELEEIEAALMAHPLVSDAVVTARGDADHTSREGDASGGIVVLDDDRALAAWLASLDRALAERLLLEVEP